MVREVGKLLRNYEGSTVVARLILGASFVRLSGFLEKGHTSLLSAYAQRCGTPELGRFVFSMLDQTTNLNCERCLALWGRFSPDWRKQLEGKDEMGELGRWKAALDGTIRVRNSQAHGGKQQESLSTLEQYYKDICRYFEFVEDKFLT